MDVWVTHKPFFSVSPPPKKMDDALNAMFFSLRPFLSPLRDRPQVVFEVGWICPVFFVGSVNSVDEFYQLKLQETGLKSALVLVFA